MPHHHPLASELCSVHDEIIGVARINGQRKAGTSECMDEGRSPRSGGEANAGVVNTDICHVKGAVVRLDAYARFVHIEFGHGRRVVIGQTDSYFGRSSFCEIKHPSLNVHRFVVHAIGFKAGDNSLTTHHGKPAVCVVEHHISTVEITSNQDTG